jgi:hypothetical protein
MRLFRLTNVIDRYSIDSECPAALRSSMPCGYCLLQISEHTRAVAAALDPQDRTFILPKLVHWTVGLLAFAWRDET